MRWRLALAVAGLAGVLAAALHHPLLAAVASPPWTWPALHAGILLARVFQAGGCFVLAAAVLAAWWGTGRLVRRWLCGRSEIGWFSLLAGLLAGSLAIEGMGLAGLLYPAALTALCASGLAAGVASWRRRPARWRVPVAFVAWAWPGLALLPAAPWLLAAPLLPPTNVDMLEYHFGVPVLWLAVHRIYAQPGNLLFTMPLGIERLSAPYLAWGAQGAAVAQTVLLLAAAALALAAALRRAGNHAAAAGGWMLAGCGAALILAADGHPDTALLLAASAGCLVVAGGGRAVDLGLVAAFACAAKYQGALLALVLAGAAVPARRRGVWLATAAGVAAGASMPWLAFNALAAGNPCYPFLSHVFPSLGWADWNTRALWDSMANASVVIERGFPEETFRQFIAVFWRGIATPWVSPLAVLVYLLPLIAAAPGHPVRRRLALAALGFAAAWAWPVPKFGRYLLPGIVPALAAFWLLWPRTRLASAAACVCAGLGGLMFIGAARARPIPPEAVLTGAATPDGYMEAAQGGYWSAARWVNAHAARGERTLVIGQGNGWGLPAPWLSNNECGLPAWFSAAGPAEAAGRMRIALRQAGIGWIVYDPVRAVSRQGYARGLELTDGWLRAYADLWRRWIDVAREPDRFDGTGEWYVYRVRDRIRRAEPHGWLPGAERLLPDETALRRGEDQLGRLTIERRYLPDFGITWLHRSMEAWARRHDARAAEAACREALRHGLALPAVYNTLGFDLWNQGRYAEAADAMRQALVLDPGNAVARANLAETLERLGRTRRKEP